jgi:hypothetical protein
MHDLLFSVPWYLPTATAIIGLALLVNGNSRQNARLRNAGGIVMLLAVGWAVMSYLVDTPKEICEKQARQFVKAVVGRDWPTFDGMMETGVDFKFVGSPWQIDGRDNLSGAVKADIEQIGLKSAAATDVTAADAGSTITVGMKVWSNQEYTMGTPLDSEWELDWRETGGHWLLHEIRAIRVSGVKPEEVRGSLRKH